MKLPPGKISMDILQKVVFKNLGATREEVIFGPAAGIDGAVLEIGNKIAIVSMDPITGAVERIGFEAVNINANDVATFGVQPAFIFSCIMLPENADSQMVENISTQMGRAAKEIGIAIVGGHCESTPSLNSPIIVCCTVGITEKGQYVTTAGVKQGDKLILTKSAGIEGTAILATDKEKQLTKTLGTKKIQAAKNYYNQISIIKEALTAYQTGGVHAMHDPTEGGILNGIHEMADAANLGVHVVEKKIIIKPETTKICKHFKIDPLQLISSGALLIAAEPKATPKIIKALKQQNIPATIIGEFNSNPKNRTLQTKKGTQQPLPKPTTDQLWIALKR